MEDAYRSTLNGAIGEMEEQFADQVAAAGGTYVLVTLENGQTLTGRAGTEVLMRNGARSRDAERRCGSHIRLDGCPSAQSSRKTTCISCRRTARAFMPSADTTVMVRGSYSTLTPASKSITPAHSLVRE